jgi:hypothetical protein
MRPALFGFLCVGVAVCLSGRSFAKGPAEVEAGQRIEQTSCLPCHSLRLIESQRLSKAAWQKEVDKMIGWGAVVSDRQVLIDYLAEHYSNTQAPPIAQRSADSK